ncbi:MAG: PilZ domain-containing protein [Desulfobacter postgatei]|uniref:PilZ domain-containing protein n=1 Tax=Desulfobacter postgatei TaxID=2293 RepID=A0A2G6MRU2_9BACT|nr:MAG: PilZ domain-containing protein [Desulfobacter postgatei]
MDHFSEKRRLQRYKQKLPMDLYRMDYQGKRNSYYAEMNDFCDNGLSLMTNEKLVLGEQIYLELKNCGPNVLLPMKKRNYRGVIRWGKRYQSSNAAANGLYKYGIQFLTHNPRP